MYKRIKGFFRRQASLHTAPQLFEGVGSVVVTSKTQLLPILQRNLQTSLAHQIECFMDSMEHIRGVGQATLQRHKVVTRELLELWADIPITSLTDRHIEEYIKHCRSKENAPQTIQTKMTSVAALCEYLVRKKLIPANPCENVDKIKVPPSEPYVFTKEQIDMLLALPDTRTEIGLRDWALMVVLLGTGVRIGELLSLAISDVDFQAEQIHLRAQITKTGRARTVPMAAMVREALRKYLARRDMMRHLHDPHLFVSSRESKGQGTRKLTRGAIVYRLGIYVKKSGMEWNTRVSPHTFRHTFATQWIVNGGDTESLMKILGHRNQQMLAYYVNLAITDLQKKNDQFNPLAHVSKPRIEELRTVVNRLPEPSGSATGRQRQSVRRSDSGATLDISKVARRWDDD